MGEADPIPLWVNCHTTAADLCHAAQKARNTGKPLKLRYLLHEQGPEKFITVDPSEFIFNFTISQSCSEQLLKFVDA